MIYLSDSGVALLDMGDSVPSVVKFMQDSIVAAGNSSYLLHWGLSGKLKYKVYELKNTKRFLTLVLVGSWIVT